MLQNELKLHSKNLQHRDEIPAGCNFQCLVAKVQMRLLQPVPAGGRMFLIIINLPDTCLVWLQYYPL